MTLEPGQRLGHYEIVASLGAGGMGEVYRARDSRLHRDVAMKILLEEVASDPERLERFEREARTIASLSHPNIVTIYSVERAEDLRFITMELVEGSTLSDLIPPGGLALTRFFELAEPIAGAVAAAHQRGITHRDLKPDNVMVAHDGTVRVLDFGLAKLGTSEQPSDDAPTQALTVAGGLLGTVPYMSPEQVQSKQADHRSDVFALGIVFYEMATGARPFQGETPADLMSSILRDTPTSVTELKADLPRHLARVIRRCLEKQPQRRYQSALDLANELTDLKREVAAGEALASRASIAVLPFANMSADPEQEFFCDGIAEDIINALTRIEDLHVVARTSAFQFKGRDLDLREVGEKLGVSTVLEGSVRKAGNRVRISAQLVNVSNGYDLWSERFDRDLEDVFAIQDEISAAIVETLKTKLLGGSRKVKREPASARAAANPEIYELLLQARFFQRTSSKEGYETAIHCLEKALELDPGFAAGHAELAGCYTALYTYGFLREDEEIAKAEHHIHRALELDDSSAKAHLALGNIQGLVRWNWQAAEREIQRGIELEPGSADAHRNYSQSVLAPLGRLEEALTEIRTSHRLDPLSVVASRNLAENLYWSGHLDEARRQFEHTLQMDPDNPLAHGQLASVYSALGDPEKALEVRRSQLLRAGRRQAADALDRAYAEAGEEGVYRWYLETLEERAKRRAISPYSRALLHGVLGEVDEAFRWLDQALEERFGLLIYVKVNPWLESLRDDPRWEVFLQRMGVA